MYSQLNAMITQQRHAELFQIAERARLIADIQAQRPRRQRTTVLQRMRGPIASAGAPVPVPVTPCADREIA